MNSRKIFMEAPADASPEVLGAYLEKACGSDLELRTEVDALFEAARVSGEQFLERPPIPRGDGGGSLASDGGLAGDEIEGYKLLQKIGEGGFGEVYMADQLRPFRRRVAVKSIKLGMDTRQVVARFEAERQALAMMDHPSIAKVFDAGATCTGRPFFVMELVKGVPITRFCDDRKLKTDERLRLFMEVCHAVQHAHQKGVIHRDLKPSNVMVTILDDKPVPKVIDFGVAKATQVELTDKTLYTRYEQFIGTPAYMSPEQAQMSGMDIDTRSDIYALGVLLYELLTGRPPFDAKELERAGELEIRRKICEDEPPCPSTRFATMGDAEQQDLAMLRRSEPRWLEARLRGDVDWIVMKTLEKERARRYETANGLAADIGRALADEPVEAGPPDLGYRLLKVVRKHRVAISMATVLGAVLLAATAISVSGWRAAIANRDLFETEAEEARNAKDLAKERSLLVSFLRAEELLATGNAELGVAQLASTARREAGLPIGKLAAERLSSALRYRSFAIPESEPVS
ncbi:MAG: serine/threonine protein kinase, partial [Verrucomicrobiales bacterium]